MLVDVVGTLELIRSPGYRRTFFAEFLGGNMKLTVEGHHWEAAHFPWAMPQGATSPAIYVSTFLLSP